MKLILNRLMDHKNLNLLALFPKVFFLICLVKYFAIIVTLFDALKTYFAEQKVFVICHDLFFG